MENFTTLTFFHFDTHKFWAFKQMDKNIMGIRSVPGLTFFKLMGTGAGAGFSLFPDFSTYAFLGVWESEMAAEEFFNRHSFFLAYKERVISYRTLKLKPVHSHGKWSGVTPFGQPSPASLKGKVVVITRATLRWQRLIPFWMAVPKASAAIEQASGVYFFKGIGEWPFIQQATVSIWESPEAVSAFAYKGKAHAEIVKKTRKQNWYKEDLFSRFELLDDAFYG